MWTNIRNEGGNLQWVKEAIEGGTGIWVTDGSYNKKIAPFVSGAGWIFYCKRRKLRLMGSFFERSPKAGSYRGELLGLLACQTLLSALEEYFNLTTGSSKVCCDSSSALYKSKEFRRRIPTGAKHADILRCLRNIKVKFKTTLGYEWVASHQDDLKLWHQLTIEQQLNCIADSLAKQAVHQSLDPSHSHTMLQTLPHERAAVYVNNIKQTTDVATDVRFALGMVDAERFYCRPVDKGGLGWSKESFHAVDWRVLDAALANKGQMYKLWLAKQCSGFCGTQTMVAHWDRARDGKCPNCQRKETARHLNLCPSRDRTRLLYEMTDDLQTWLDTSYAHTELAYWLPRYIKLRGTRSLTSFPLESREMMNVATALDAIGWVNFMEGKLPKALFSMQASALACSPSRLSIVDWSKQLVSRILHISHAQWIFRNFTLHDKAQGYLTQVKRQAILKEIDKLAQLDPNDIPPGS